MCERGYVFQTQRDIDFIHYCIIQILVTKGNMHLQYDMVLQFIVYLLIVKWIMNLLNINIDENKSGHQCKILKKKKY